MEFSGSVEQVQGYISNATRFMGVRTQSMASLTNMQRDAENVPVKILEDSLQLTQEAIEKCRREQ